MPPMVRQGQNLYLQQHGLKSQGVESELLGSPLWGEGCGQGQLLEPPPPRPHPCHPTPSPPPQAWAFTMAGRRPQLKRSFSIIPCFVFVEVRSRVPPLDLQWGGGIPFFLSPLCPTSVFFILARSLSGPMFSSPWPQSAFSLPDLSLPIFLRSESAVPFLLRCGYELAFRSGSIGVPVLPCPSLLLDSGALPEPQFPLLKMGIFRVPLF